MVSVPVKLYGATEESGIKAHQVHGHDGGRIRYKRVCETCEETVEFRDIAKGYEVDDQIVVVYDDELDSTGKSREMEVMEFVPAEQIDPVMFDKSYMLAPDGKSTPKAYKLLAETLKRSGRVAIGYITIRSKTRLAALRVRDYSKRNVIMVHTLAWPEELREADFPTLDKEVEITDGELEMADTLIKSLSRDFNPDRYRDASQEELLEIIEAKRGGAAAVTLPDPAEEVRELLAKLEASIKGGA